MAGRGKSASRKRTPRAKPTSGRAKDAVALLKADHREVEKLFKKYQGLGERAIKSKGTTIQKVCTELQVHDVLERELLYPMTEPIDGKLTEHALEEHQEVNDLIEEIQNTEPDDERMEGLMAKLISDVKEHVQEEEKQLFPKLQKGLDKITLKETGKAMSELKKRLQSKRRRAA